MIPGYAGRVPQRTFSVFIAPTAGLIGGDTLGEHT